MPSHKISQVILTLQAKEDLQDILQYTEQTWGASQRRRYASLLAKAIKSLYITPLLGHKSVVLGRNYRILHMGKHLAVYKVEEDVVTIVRVLHQNRDVERHL